jgi:peptide/nickel transport system permease protein
MQGQFLASRVTQALFTIVLVVVVNFLLFRAMPGSPDRVLSRNPNVTEEARAATRARWGLDKPLFPDQFVAFVGATARGDLGYSTGTRGELVVDILGRRIWPTVILFGLGEVVAIIIGLALGAYSGWRRGGPIDLIGNGVSLILYSTPYFLFGMALLLIFASNLHWFPTNGMLTPGAAYGGPFDQLRDFLAHLALPLATVSLGLVGQYAIVMRSSIIETLSEDYITTARGMGLRDGRVLRAHALPNALLPTVTLIAINLGYVVAGAITVEVVFNWPGLGTLTVNALAGRDYPVLQGVFLLLSISVILANLAADMIYALLDPRVRS